MSDQTKRILELEGMLAQALAASAAREIAMRDRAAKTAIDNQDCTPWEIADEIRALIGTTATFSGETGRAKESLIDLIGELGREVYYLLDDCEESGPAGDSTFTVEKDSVVKVSGILDRIDALPFEEPGVILGTGAKLQAALKQTFLALPLSPDGQQAVDDERAKAWDDGWICRPVMGMHENPHRTQPSRSSNAGTSEDRG